MKILLLGGTSEAREIAKALRERGDIDAILSLAGVTENPSDFGLKLRLGGFGGVKGLAEYLGRERVDVVIDATHPYANTISANAGFAAEIAKIKRLALWRPSWIADTKDDWRLCSTWDGLFADIPDGGRLFLSGGQDGINALIQYKTRFRVDFKTWARAMMPPDGANRPSDGDIILIQSPPKDSAAAEAALFTELGITHIACKNSGGRISYAKLMAAQQLKLPVLMLDRPPPPPPPLFDDAAAVIDALNLYP